MLEAQSLIPAYRVSMPYPCGHAHWLNMCASYAHTHKIYPHSVHTCVHTLIHCSHVHTQAHNSTCADAHANIHSHAYAH